MDRLYREKLNSRKEYIKQHYSVEIKSTETGDEECRYSFKVKNGFNYVNRVTVVTSKFDGSLLSTKCNCVPTNPMAYCDHRLAAILELEGSSLANIINDVKPSAVTEEPKEASDENISAVEPENDADAETQAHTNDIVNDEELSPEAPEDDIFEELPGDVSDELDGGAVVDINDEFVNDYINGQIAEPDDAPAAEPGEAREEDFVFDGSPRRMEVLFGKNTENGEPLYWLPNDTEKVFHTNTGIIGTMGTGKTQFTKSLVTQLYREQLSRNNFNGSPLNILIFDYKGDYNETKPEFVKAVDAKVFKPYYLRYNPLALNQGSSFRPLLPVHTANVFKDTLTKSFRLGPKQQALLLDCILKAYEKQGIMPEVPSTWNRPAPTFEQVYHIYTDVTADKTPDSLTAAMNKLYQFRIFEPNPNKSISLSALVNGVTVIDLSGYEDDIQSFVVAITLDQFYAQMITMGSSQTDGRFRQLRSLILVDEADNFMKEDFPSLKKIMKEGREFGVGLILSTQSLTHFIGGEDDYSRYVLTWVVHNVSDLSQKDVEYIFKLGPKSPDISGIYSQIKGLVKHESVTKIANADPIKIRDKAFFELDF